MDPFNNPTVGMSDPIVRSFDIVPDATDPLDKIPRAIYVGGEGDLICRLVDDDSDRTFSNVPAGALLPFRVSHVRNTSTATLLIGLY